MQKGTLKDLSSIIIRNISILITINEDKRSYEVFNDRNQNMKRDEISIFITTSMKMNLYNAIAKKSASKRTAKVQNNNKNFLIRNDFSVAFKVSIFARSDTF